jgi:DNA modification methylase
MTTLVAAANLGRQGVAVELNPEYARLGAARLQRAIGLLGTVELIGDDRSCRA